MQDWVSSTSATSTSCSHCELHAVSFYLYPHLFPLLRWTFVLSLFPHIYLWVFQPSGFPGGSDGKESACNSGDLGLIPGLGISPGEVNGNPLQHSCLKNPMGRATLGVTVQSLQSQHDYWATDCEQIKWILLLTNMESFLDVVLMLNISLNPTKYWETCAVIRCLSFMEMKQFAQGH